MLRTGSGAAALVFFSASGLIFGLRDWLICGGRLYSPVAVPRVPSLLLHNQLQGWFHEGTMPLTMKWHAAALKAAAAWEWLPALFFLCGLVSWSAWLAARGVTAPPQTRRSGPPDPGRGRADGPAAPRSRGAFAALRWRGWLLALGAAAAVFSAASFISLVAFQHTPHVQDSIAQLFQARIFASGRLWAPVPPLVDFTGMEFLVADHGRWFSQYPPGHSALLALGVLIGAPWLVNPLLGGLSAIALYGAARAAYGARIARMSVVIFALSPFVWFMSGEFMNHASTMFWGALALWIAASAGRRDEAGRAVPWGFVALSGLMVGLAATSRPLTAAAFALPLALYWLSFHGRAWARAGRVLLFATVCGAAVTPALWFNWLTTGKPLLFGYEVRWGASGLGFGGSQWGPPHTPLRGLDQTWRNLDALGKYLLAWPIPALLPLAGLWWLRGRLRRYDLLLLGWPLSLMVVHFFYFYQDLCLGPRFLYCATPPLAMLISRSLTGLGAALAPWWRRRRRDAGQTVWRAALAVTGAGLALNLPGLWVWYFHSFWGVDPEFTRRVDRRIHTPSIVFVTDANRAREVRLVEAGVSPRVAHSATVWLDDAWIDRVYVKTLAACGGDPSRARPALERAYAQAAVCDDPHPRRRREPWLDYRGPISSFAQAFVGNGPDLERQKVIFALDLGPKNRDLAAAYPHRTAWKYTWDPGEGAFRLVRLDDWLAAVTAPQQ